MHVLEEDKESLSDQLEFSTGQCCIHLKIKKVKLKSNFIKPAMTKYNYTAYLCIYTFLPLLKMQCVGPGSI